MSYDIISSFCTVVVSTFRLHHCIALQLLGTTLLPLGSSYLFATLHSLYRRSLDLFGYSINDLVDHRPHTQSTHNHRQCSQQVCDHYCCCRSPCEQHSLKQHKPAITARNSAAGNTTTSHTWAPTTVPSSETRQQAIAHPVTSFTTAQSNCKPACVSSQPKSTQKTGHGAFAIAAAICSTPAH